MSRIGIVNNTTPSTEKKPKDLKDLDVNQFLQLMISELTNQDPLNPMDNSQLVQQLGSIREISATDKLTDTLSAVATGQSLTTASSLIGKEVQAIDDLGGSVTGVVDKVTVNVDESDSNKRSYRVHVGSQSIDLRNVREVVG